MNKILTLSQAIAEIEDGDTVAIGGNVLHRAPMALVREILRQQKVNLKLVKTAGAMDIDMLCLGGCAQSVDAGFISYESEFGLAAHYRKAVQSKAVKGNEHACYTVISALRAASMGIPFMPVRGLKTGDLIQVNDYFERIKDPFSQESITVVQAIRPDIALIHVHEADENGNAYIEGPLYDDIIMSRAAKKVIISAEKICPVNKFKFAKQKPQIPHFMVDAVVPVKKGAAPCSCQPLYQIDRKSIHAFKRLKTKEELPSYLESYKSREKR